MRDLCNDNCGRISISIALSFFQLNQNKKLGVDGNRRYFYQSVGGNSKQLNLGLQPHARLIFHQTRKKQANPWIDLIFCKYHINSLQNNKMVI